MAQYEVRSGTDKMSAPALRTPKVDTDEMDNYKVTFIGHSYVRDLANRQYGFVLGGKRVSATYIAVPGGTFKTYLRNEHYFERLRTSRPDVIVAILGGNDIKTDAGLPKNFEDCVQFLRILRETVPGACIIASQLETRYYRPNNRHGCPTNRIYDGIRRRFNRFLHRQKFHDFILEIEGHLDAKINYRDGIHLSKTGFETYLDLIQMTLSFAPRKRF